MHACSRYVTYVFGENKQRNIVLGKAVQTEDPRFHVNTIADPHSRPFRILEIRQLGE
jgi:hypothetical protein